jgi:hypothetical protein
MRGRFLWIGVLSFIFSLGFVSSVHAAQLTNVAARLTRQATATSTDMELSFTSPTGVNGGSDSITIVFPSEFDVSTIVAADISLSYGPVTGYEHVTSVAASAAVGVWGPQLISHSLFLIPPTDTGVGSIPAGSRIILRMGLWTGGTHQLLTPNAIGIYPIRIRGNFGDAGIGYVEIRGADGLTVTATVAASPVPGGGSSPGGGAGPGAGSTPVPSDGTAPTIIGLGVDSITATSAVVHWTTDEAADAFIGYGLTWGVYTVGTRERTGALMSHEFLLDSLLPETEYHFHVRARDAVGNTRWSEDKSFVTAALPSALTITGIEVISVDDRQATIRWTTNMDVVGEVLLDVSPSVRTFSEMTPGRTHLVTVTGLTASTLYAFRVSAIPAAGDRLTVTGPGFRTLSDTTPPSNVLNFRGVYSAPPRAVELTWINPTDADFKDVIVTRYTDAALSAEVFVCATTLARCTDIPPTGASSLTYRAVAQDLFGNRASGAIAMVTIPTEELPPVVTPPTALPVEPTVIPGTGPDVVVTPSRPRPPASAAEGGHVLPPILHPETSGTEPVVVSDGTGAGSATSSLEDVSGVSTVTSTPAEGVSSDAPLLDLVPTFFLSDTVMATPDASGVRSALISRSIQIRLPISGIGTALSEAQVQTSGGAIYQFAYREGVGAFVSDLQFDAAQGENQFLQIQAIATDGRRWQGRFPFHVWSPALVLDVSERARTAPVATATVELIAIETGATVFQIQTNDRGRYAEIVSNGRYHLRVSKAGFRTFEREVRVETGVLVQNVELRRALRPLSQVIDPNASLSQNIAALGSEAVLAAQIGLDAARSPEVQAATQHVVAPVVVVATVGATATAVTGFNLLNYLQFLFTQPLLLIRRRKRKSWGIVYNALSKQPIELAIVRLLKAGTNFALQTRITDAQGRFSFFVPPGSYTIQVQKPGFVFPTKYLQAEHIDVDFVDLYHGEEVKVAQPVTISPNIPVDPIAKEETPSAITRKRYLRGAQSALGVGGIIVSLGAIVISPTLPMIGFAVFQIATYALFRRLAIPAAPKRWGIVYDSDGKIPLAKAIVRIFDKKFNKLLETQITSKDGTYGFFAAKGHYYLTAEKPGYERYLSADLDLTKAEDTYIDHRFSLKRAGTALK